MSRMIKADDFGDNSFFTFHMRKPEPREGKKKRKEKQLVQGHTYSKQENLSLFHYNHFFFFFNCHAT